MIYLITGASGFIGSHLVTYLRKAYPMDEIHTLDRRIEPAASGSHSVDLLDTDRLTKVVGEIQPDRVYHLAGFSRVSGNEGLPENFELNYLGTTSLLKALEKSVQKEVSFFLASSTFVYGNQTQKVSEDSPLQPTSPYGFSKYLAEEAARHATQSNPKLSVVVGRLYNNIGPGQPSGFVVPDLCGRIRDALKKEESSLRTGPLEGRRSFMDVRDTVKILVELLSRPQPSHFEVYNLASPQTHTIREIVDTLVELSGKELEVRSSNEIAPNTFAGLDVGTEKLSRTLHPTFRPLKETLKDTLENELKKDIVS